MFNEFSQMVGGLSVTELVTCHHEAWTEYLTLSDKHSDGAKGLLRLMDAIKSDSRFPKKELVDIKEGE